MNVRPCSLNTPHGSLQTHSLEDPDKTEFIEQLKGLLAEFNPKGTYPGPNPCSIERSDLRLLSKSRYKICDKTDGVRVLFACLLFKGHKIAALVTRGFDVYICKIDKCPKVWKQGTVFDGEIATVDGTPRFVGFDAIFVSGIPVWKSPLSKRLEAAAMSLTDYAWTPGEVEITFKTYYDSIDAFIARPDAARAPEDGIILTPEDEPVRVGRHRTLYKMKPQGKHTVDFKLQNSRDLLVYNPGTKTHSHVASLQASVDLQEGAIVECAMSGPGIWTYLSVRTDKNTANDMLTYKKTMVNIEEDLTIEHIKKALV